MQFLLFRHADKERSFSANPNLSPAGYRQAKALVELLNKAEIPAPTQLLCSPKSRALQTLEPLSQSTGLRIQQSPELLERQSQESAQEFLSRVKSCIRQYEKLGGVVYVVTHFDWIEEFLLAIHCHTDFSDSQFHSWAPCQFMEFEVKEAHWHFCKMGRTPL